MGVGVGVGMWVGAGVGSVRTCEDRLVDAEISGHNVQQPDVRRDLVPHCAVRGMHGGREVEYGVG